MSSVIDLLLILVLLLAMGALASNRIARCARIVAAQGVVLAVLFIVSHLDDITPHLVAVAAATAALKGLVIPWLLFRSMREAGVQREVEPYIGFQLSVVLGALAVGVAFVLSELLPLPEATISQLVVPVSLATLFIGLLLLVSRKKAVTQVLGYIVLENGIFVFGLALARELPTLIEMGVLLDIFVGVFVMGITIYQINKEFDHIDANKLQELNDMNRRRHRIPHIRGTEPPHAPASDG